MYNFYFKIENEKYNYIGLIYEYFYAGGYVPSTNKTCSDLLEQLQFLHEIYLELMNDKFFNICLPQDAIIQLQALFDSKEEYDLTHWRLFQFKSFDKIHNNNCIYDNLLREIVIITDNVSLHIPYPFELLFDQPIEEDLFTKIREKQIDLSQLKFNIDEETLKSALFMSNKQLIKNQEVINNLTEPIYLLLTNYGYDVKNCKDLTLLLNSNG